MLTIIHTVVNVKCFCYGSLHLTSIKKNCGFRGKQPFKNTT